MHTLRGIPASPGAVDAALYLYEPDRYEIPASWPDLPEKAVAELAAALDEVAGSFSAAATSAAGEVADILRAQAAIAGDPALRQSAEPDIRAGVHPAKALLDAGEDFASQLERSGNAYLSARAPDVRHICDVAARRLVGAPTRQPPQPSQPCVLIATDLMPVDTAGLTPELVRGLVTARGSRMSHTSVIARSLGIPAVVGVLGLVDAAAGATHVAVDGGTGEVILDPDPAALERIARARAEQRLRRERVRAAAGTGATLTTDGVRVEVAANVSGLEELAKALDQGAEAVGLLRTELLYRGRHEPPTEEEQLGLLRGMRELLGDRRLLVRTFDIGADKTVPFLPVRPERNPELGLRGLRLARSHPELLDTQLWAIASVAETGPTAVMAPMVANVDDARWFRSRVEAAGMPASVEVGVMVEVPALALMADQLAKYVDFVSIGTNDLGQYLFAADRRDEAMADLLDPFAPALLRAVAAVSLGMSGRGWVGVCGEAASDPAWALLAVGLGVTELSMQAIAVPEVRAALRGVSADACRAAAMRALNAAGPVEARAIGARLVKELS
ncbi:MAG TPA: phosphoenolpyruvate--protein phosphotransferase [Mycobacteriales bacterium]|nr:phosphoenolpyruvate--protein phosphotransferase [Mycobacteriales bacterium]